MPRAGAERRPRRCPLHARWNRDRRADAGPIGMVSEAEPVGTNVRYEAKPGGRGRVKWVPRGTVTDQ